MLPTQEAYSELQAAYDHFNRHLFGGQLPPCLITLQREKKTYGYFSRARFVRSGGTVTDEIAMNPRYFAVVPTKKIMQFLVHDMTHLWQSHFGSPGRRGYHNKEMAAKLEGIGLMPSDTGEPGGKRVGEKMDTYCIAGGPFDVACKQLFDAAFSISWKDRFPEKGQLQHVVDGDVDGVDIDDLVAIGVDVDEAQKPDTKSNRRKYSCPQCKINAWGKPGLNLVCGDCGERLVDTSEDAPED